MSDLIERLRQVIVVDGLRMPGPDALHAEAADRIAELEAEVERLRFQRDEARASVDFYAAALKEVDRG